MNSGQHRPRALFEPHHPGLTSTSSMTDIEREELRRLAVHIENEQDPERVLAVAQEMNELLDRILSRVPKAPLSKATNLPE
jgi:hypothetical protein